MRVDKKEITESDEIENSDVLFGVEEIDDYVTVRSSAFRRARIFYSIGIISVISLIILVFARSWFIAQIDPSGDPGGSKEIVLLESATSNADVAETLASNGVVPNSTFFRLWATYRNSNAEYLPGTYEMQTNMSVDEALAVLSEGPNDVAVTFAIPDGLCLDKSLPFIAAQVPGLQESQLQDFVSTSDIDLPYGEPGISWEGYIYPGEYSFTEETIDADIVMREVRDKFQSAAAGDGYGAVDGRLGVSGYQTLVIASLLDKEIDEHRDAYDTTDPDQSKKLRDDLKKISRVMHNRLANGQHLEVDFPQPYRSEKAPSAIIESTEKLLASDGALENSICGPEVGPIAFATLPETPITNPSDLALHAAANPLEGDWLYYVLENPAESRYFFSSTLEGHEKALKRASDAESLLLQGEVGN